MENAAKHRILIRPVQPEELLLLTGLFDYGDVEDMLSKNRAGILEGRMEIFGLFREGRLIGELRAAYEKMEERFCVKGARAYLYAFRVHPDAQGAGLGQRLMEWVLNELEGRGYSEFTIGVEDDNEMARHIYEKFGFSEKLSTEKESYQGDEYSYSLLLRRAK